MRNATPWFLVFLAMIFAVSPAAQRARESDSTEERAETETTEAEPSEPPPPKPSCAPTTGGEAPAWCEPVRLLADYFGIPLTGEGAIGKDEKEALLNGLKRPGLGYSFEILIALVPDPFDSRLPFNADLAIDAVQSGFSQAEYLLDRVWLPWSGAEVQEGAHPGAPGVMLFRKGLSDNARRLAVVFLVGESPKSGIQREAFDQALNLSAALLGAGLPMSGRDIRILGPSFSGSVESLRMALQNRRGLRFDIATGTATASGLEEALDTKVGVGSFCRAVLPDAVLQREALSFLRDEMGWNLSEVVLLTESDTAYGRNLMRAEASAETKTGVKRAGEDPLQRIVVVQFPSHVSDLRNRSGEPQERTDISETLQELLRPSREAVDLKLTDSRAVDLVPVFDPLMTSANDLKLSNLLEAISREGFRYVGILATDVKDKLFLADRIRRYAPDTVLFTFDNHLLFAHPKVDSTMDGTLVFSSFPLFTEGTSHRTRPPDQVERRRRQFIAEFQQGIFQATAYLLNKRSVEQPSAWILAVGNGSLWPIARRTVTIPQGAPENLCGVTTNEAQATFLPWMKSNRADLELLLVALLLALSSARLHKVALLKEFPGAAPNLVAVNRWLLASGALLLALAAGLLVAVGRLALPDEWLRDPLQAVIFLGLVLTYFVLVLQIARAFHQPLRVRQAVPWIIAGIGVLAALDRALEGSWIPDGQLSLFLLRARAFTSGLSPLVGLAALGAAFCTFVYYELDRRRLMARQATDCPLAALGEPSVAGREDILARIRDLLTSTFPSGMRFWVLPVAFLPPALLLVKTMQPIGETKAFGYCFLALMVVTTALAALSFYRFVALWSWTHRLLRRLDDVSPAWKDAFEANKEDLGWRPIQSFGWRIPPFRMLVLSISRLRELVTAQTLQIPGYPQVVDEPLEKLFENATPERLADEIARRGEFEKVFAKVCQDLRKRGLLDEPGVRRFLALRVAAYFRYVTAHMRNSLLGALFPWVLVLVAVTAYAFEPKQFVSLAIWVALGGAVLLTFRIFLQMDRNTTLSRIAGTTPGKAAIDKEFLTNFFPYAGIPLLGILATQFPEISRLLGDLSKQLLQVTGGG
jgi:hypothetical protein